jgi:hypothetical protein
MKGRRFGFGDQESISSHRKLPSSKSDGAERYAPVRPVMCRFLGRQPPERKDGRIIAGVRKTAQQRKSPASLREARLPLRR